MQGPEARREVSGSTVGRAARIVDELFARAAAQGERVAAWARLLIGGMVLVTWPALVWDELRAGRPQVVVTMALAGVAVASSVVILVGWRRGGTTFLLQAASIALDALIVGGILLAFVRWPSADHRSLHENLGISLFVLGILTAGARLSRRGAALGIGLHSLSLALLLVLDKTWNGARTIELLDYVTLWTFMVASSLLAFTIAARTRRLVLEGATQALLAARAKERLGTYVSEEVAAESLTSDELRLGGKRQEVAVLFSDLRGFTAYSETLEPEDLVRQLNAYLDVMVAAIRKEGGVIDKFIGDAVMAVFGVPRGREDDAARAVRAALRMQRALSAHNEDRQRRGLPPLSQGIGVHFGPVVAGNVGTVERASYTVVGDTVNLASRLESATKEQGVSVLVSEAAVEAARRAPSGGALPQMTPVGTLTVRGREQPVRVYTLDLDVPLTDPEAAAA